VVQEESPPRKKERKGKRKQTKEHIFDETKYKANKTPQMWSKKIPRRKKTGPMEREEEHTCSSAAFPVAGIAFAFVVVFLRVLVRARGGLAESYLARKKRELLVGCAHFAFCSQMPTAFTLLSDNHEFTKLRGGVCFYLLGGSKD
jgi:hypothetical protein